MILFRSAQSSDLDAIHQLAQQSEVGLTTLPKDKELLRQRLDWSCESFKVAIEKATHEFYLFVLEDQDSKKIIGTSAIEAKTGSETPFYSYKISKRTRICHSLDIRNEYEVLNLVNDNQRTEICTLFLAPEYRKNHNGRLLSKGRFLFLAQYPMRFTPTIIADIRGVSNDQGISPFWEQIGSHFFRMTFTEADRLTLATNKQFIADLMPHNPIYVCILAPEAQAVIGQPHPSSIPAMNILLKEGFRYNNYVDIFDAGPTIEAPLNEIKTCALSRVMVIKSLSDEVISNTKYLLANTEAHFRATQDCVVFNLTDSSCIISKKTAQLLQVKCGDSLRIAPTKFNEIPSL